MPRKSWSKGAKKAHANFVDQYGPEQGERIFWATANKLAAPAVKQLPQNQRASRVFATGNQQTEGHGGQKKRRQP